MRTNKKFFMSSSSRWPTRVGKGLDHLNGLTAMDHCLAGAYFTALARLNLAIHLDLAFADQVLGDSTAVAQPREFQEIAQLDVLATLEAEFPAIHLFPL